MKPMYFPFTRITEPIAGAIFRRLGPFAVCRELEEDSFQYAVGSGGAPYIEPVYPAADSSDRIVALVEEYMKCGNLHRDDMAVFSRFGNAEFYNNEFSANISMQIKKRGGGESEIDDPVFMARLFLCLARRLDTREDEVLHEIEAADITGRSLVAELTGNTPAPSLVSGFFGNSSPPGDPGEVATQTRLSAFFRLLCQQEQIPRLYVTSSHGVMESLIDRFSGMTLLTRIDDVPESGDGPEPGTQAQPAWISNLVNLASIHDNAVNMHNALPGFPVTGSTDEYHMEIYAVDACPPADFVSELAAIPYKKGETMDSEGLTLVFLLSC